jgi:hypothetical protein
MFKYHDTYHKGVKDRAFLFGRNHCYVIETSASKTVRVSKAKKFS